MRVPVGTLVVGDLLGGRRVLGVVVTDWRVVVELEVAPDESSWLGLHEYLPGEEVEVERGVGVV